MLSQCEFDMVYSHFKFTFLKKMSLWEHNSFFLKEMEQVLAGTYICEMFTCILLVLPKVRNNNEQVPNIS